MKRAGSLRRRALALLAVAVAAAPLPATAQRYVGILVPYFEGQGQVGRNVSTALYLQIWRTLRRAPTPNPRRLDFGRGIAFYDTAPLRPGSAAAALERTADDGPQLVLWGEVTPLGDEAVVQAYLVARERHDLGPLGEIWRIRDGSQSVELGLPRTVFTFDAVALSRQVVSRYASPDAMTMCATKVRPCGETPLTDDWTALAQEGGWAKVRNRDGRVGYVELSALDTMPNLIAEFASGLVSYYRQDFGQAGRYFARVSARRDVQASLRHDAAVLSAISMARDGQGADALFDAAARVDEYSLYAFQARAMYRLQQTLKKPANDARAELASLRRAIDANRELFEPRDEWLRQIDAILRNRGF